MKQFLYCSRRNFLRAMTAVSAAAALRPGVGPAESAESPGPLLTRPIPSSGEAIPVVGLGSWITFNVGDDPKALNDCAEVMRHFFAGGGRMVDSSPMYGSSRETIGYGLKKLGKTDAVFAAGKVWTLYFGSGGAEQIEASRNYWNVQRFDLMQVHNLGDWEEHLPMLLAVLAYPLLAPLAGRGWAQLELFAVTADPTVIGTLGLLLLAANGAFWSLLVIPLLWCALSGATLWTMGAPEAMLPACAGLLAILLAAGRRCRCANAQGLCDRPGQAHAPGHGWRSRARTWSRECRLAARTPSKLY